MMLELLKTRVESEWIDYNSHLNVVYYHLVFDRATDRFLDQLGLGESTARKRLGSIFALENHITYQRELKLSDPLRVTLLLLDHDEKRIHYFMRMFHHERDYLAATCEHLSIYVDFHKRHATPLPTEARAKLEEIYQAHRKLLKPEEAVRVIGIRRR